VVHHFEDAAVAARELRRVVRPGGVVIVRGTLRDSLPGIPLFDYFPAARPIAEWHHPSADEVAAVFARERLELVLHEGIEHQLTESLRAWYERVRVRAISTLEVLDDAEFEEGLARLRAAAERETEPEPVVERVDLLVFRR
jgi:SAM-dependent methyltransferase